jgi:DNA topoisomerase-1
MTPAQYDSTTLTVRRMISKRAAVRCVSTAGPKSCRRCKGDEDRTLPVVKGDRLSLVELTPAQHFTKPLARFSKPRGQRAGKTRYRPSVHLCVDHFDHSGSRLRAGGKPSFTPKNGRDRHRSLEENFRDLMNYDFTAQMEDRLDQAEPPGRVEAGARLLRRLNQQPAERSGRGGMQPNPMVLTSIDCPTWP